MRHSTACDPYTLVASMAAQMAWSNVCAGVFFAVATCSVVVVVDDDDDDSTTFLLAGVATCTSSGRWWLRVSQRQQKEGPKHKVRKNGRLFV